MEKDIHTQKYPNHATRHAKRRHAREFIAACLLTHINSHETCNPRHHVCTTHMTRRCDTHTILHTHHGGRRVDPKKTHTLCLCSSVRPPRLPHIETFKFVFGQVCVYSLRLCTVYVCVSVCVCDCVFCVMCNMEQ